VVLKGLAVPIQELLVPLDLPPDLDSLIALAIRMDNRVCKLKSQQRSALNVSTLFTITRHKTL